MGISTHDSSRNLAEWAALSAIWCMSTAAGRAASEQFARPALARRPRLDAPFEHCLQPPVVALVLVERQIVHEQDEALRPPAQHPYDRGEVSQVVASHLDQPQAALGVLVQQRLDRGRLAGATVP